MANPFICLGIILIVLSALIITTTLILKRGRYFSELPPKEKVEIIDLLFRIC